MSLDVNVFTNSNMNKYKFIKISHMKLTFSILENVYNENININMYILFNTTNKDKTRILKFIIPMISFLEFCNIQIYLKYKIRKIKKNSRMNNNTLQREYL